MMHRIPTEKIISLPSTAHSGGVELVPQLRHLFRDAAGGLWALGDQLVLFSSDGGNWRDLTLNLREDIGRGGFTAHAVLVQNGEVHLFVRNWRGLSSYGLKEWRQEWVSESEIDIDGSLVAVATVSDSLMFLASCKSVLCEFRSIDRAQSWTMTPLGLDGVPSYLQLSPTGAGVCCLWHALEGTELSQQDRSSVYSTADYGRTWQHVATVDTMVLCGCPAANNCALLGGSNGQLLMFDPRTGIGLQRLHSDDIVAVDVLGDKVFALTESQASPVQNSVLLRRHRGNWSTRDLHLQDRVSGTKLLSDHQAVVCTTREIYLCRLS